MNPSILPTIDASANRWMDEVIALRRDIHAHPELAFEERETARRVQAFLQYVWPIQWTLPSRRKPNR